MVKKTVTKSIKTLVNSALGGVWRNQLLKNSVLRVEGLLGVTLSNKEVLLVHVDELLSDQALLLLQTDDEDSDVAAPVGEPIKARVKSPAKRGRKRKYPQSKKGEIPSVQPTSLVDNFVVLQADSGQPVQNFPLDIYSEANPVLDEATQDDDLDHVDQVISVKEERHDMSYGEPDTGHDDAKSTSDWKDDSEQDYSMVGRTSYGICTNVPRGSSERLTKVERHHQEISPVSSSHLVSVDLQDYKSFVRKDGENVREDMPASETNLEYPDNQENEKTNFLDRKPTSTVCELCGTAFSNVNNLNVHMRYRHFGLPKKFPCDQCDKQFSRLPDLEDHKNLHLNQKPYHCVCEQSFTTRKSLQRHMRTCAAATQVQPVSSEQKPSRNQISFDKQVTCNN